MYIADVSCPGVSEPWRSLACLGSFLALLAQVINARLPGCSGFRTCLRSELCSKKDANQSINMSQASGKVALPRTTANLRGI
ncbi:uncharacterized protein BO80DRAFT_107830 [Aspergillus ibericus CBS 121593]|uniref:Secreted protein n=1 Tax=Aspergillus ibericus CBS 121593 TaxID=1448316 RepID=A0A395H1L6_9EURO|nr:hypothetical protein BO80DRAFT_107830 [Aspergillus ibericus CBS 121593]RAL00104.1 hypothetical protein BO80DRAFT_107830 [Aspergillus ibericus CBS 121593]